MGQILVTGGTGFVGSAVVRALCTEGERPRVLARKGSPTENLDGLSYDLVHGDLGDVLSIESAMKDVEYVFHTAAVHKVTAPREEIITANVLGTRNVLKAAAKAKVKRLVHTSSTAAIGSAPPEGLADEETIWDLGPLEVPYLDSKFLAEREVLQWIPRGLDAVIVNPSAPIGPGDRIPGPTGAVILSFARRPWPFYFQGTQNYVDVDDVADGHLKALRKGRTGERYLLTHANFTMKEMVREVTRAAGKRPPPIGIPVPFLQIGARIGALITLGALPHKSADYLEKRIAYANTKAIKELGFSPRPIGESFDRAIAYFRSKGWM